MEILIDLHNHTVASGHAYSTALEIAKEAGKKGMKYIAITDHGPSIEGGPNLMHVYNLRILPNKLYDVEVLKGTEANVLNQDGELDVPDELLKELDIVLAGFHEGPIEAGSREDNTRTICNVMENEYVDVIVHPGNPRFPIYMEEVVLKAKRMKKLIEINNSSFLTSRIGSRDNCYEIALLCKKHCVPVVVNSDSHFAMDVGNLEEGIKLLNEINMPMHLVINSCVEGFENYMRTRDKQRFIK